MSCSKLKCISIYLSTQPTNNIKIIKKMSDQLKECLDCDSNCKWACIIQKKTVQKLKSVLKESRNKFLNEN